MAKVTKAFPGKPDGATAVRTIEVGEEIHGDLARVAVENGWAKESGKPKAAAQSARADD